MSINNGIFFIIVSFTSILHCLQTENKKCKYKIFKFAFFATIKKARIVRTKKKLICVLIIKVVHSRGEYKLQLLK